MSDSKTQPTPVDPTEFINAVPHPTRRADALVLDALFQHITGFSPKMWGQSIVGYGAYDYRYASGRTGTSLATGFSPRKTNLSIYIMPGYADFSDILARLGKHKVGKSCLYVNKLADIHIAVLEELIRAGLDDLSEKWPVHPN